MASPAEPPLGDSASDYGSDFSPDELRIVEQLLSGQQVEDDNPVVNEIEHHDRQNNLRLPRVFGREEMSPIFQAARAAEWAAEQIRKSCALREPQSDLGNYISEEVTTDTAPLSETVELADNKAPDTRSPLERFRTEPRKALSVSDLVAPAWCELQYWYTLTLHGRKRRTPAMKQGSAVHQVLEDQVHTTVKVDVQTKEDAWGLRIWNVIQGLRTLRNTGLTRELEVWGTVDGLPVTGIIDEVSYICPDTALEESLQARISKNEPPPDQATISDFFKTLGSSSIAEATKPRRRARTKKIYLGDVKTRSVKSLPSAMAFHPTRMQLMLYHSLLSSIATNSVDFSIITTRYKLDPDKAFSDAFLAQVGSLNDEVLIASLSQDSEPQWSQDSMVTLLAHNTLSTLWSLMISEFQITLPEGVESLGSILKAEYRSRDTGEILGNKTFVMDTKELSIYIEHEMEWWRGKREAQGVNIDQAFKCRSCEFADNCEWRLKKVDEAREKFRTTRQGSSAV